ncbi:tripartite tricarboxylate transporter permease [Salipiger thiooxidans]|uniref:tripartite tricarboxylate transporter permease n=1 Tax=Salipiger thiooxidans TaxID=282683 RepID=UPI001CD5CD16|nr:tripartite tricarboxylate transporter permease [Salipiger thiooxidans]MCA0849783.1 tripartite tricarboxylate transporter permease [Salipiger thiooxidans]
MTLDLMQTVLAGLFTPTMLLLIFGGVTAGIVVGALPGLSATMALALMIPVTFGMEPLPGIMLLIAIYAGSMFGGSVPAILLHTPGTPSAAATAMDGYQMTRKGQGGQALGVAAIASTAGGVFSALALLFIAPPLAKISLMFSAPEYFLIAVFGLTIIATVVAGSLVKALFAGTLGLLIGTVGIDIFTGMPRFTFGVDELQSGISLVPAMIGLFSISQILIQIDADRAATGATEGPGPLGRIFPEWSLLKRLRGTIAQSSVIGLLLGILPGTGGEIASWVSYNEARRRSKRPADFGTGLPEGVAAPEAANNAVTGGAMIPLMTLGIPANIATAVLMGGFLIQGLTPGRGLFTQQAELTYSIIFGFVLANLVMGAIALVAARWLALISRVPQRLIVPLILGFSVVGAYSIGNSMFDVGVMLAFGALGFLARRTGFHPAPIVLGMLLGPIAESGLRQALVMADVAGQPLLLMFLTRPMSLAILALMALSLLGPQVLRVLRHMRGPSDDISTKPKRRQTQ